jgi:hypothetical protein
MLLLAATIAVTGCRSSALELLRPNADYLVAGIGEADVKRMQRMAAEMPFAQLFLKLPRERVQVFLLADKQGGQDGSEAWIGPGGARLHLSRGRVRLYQLPDEPPASFYVWKEGAVGDYLRGLPTGLVASGTDTMVWSERLDGRGWLEQPGTVRDLGVRPYVGLAYQGPAQGYEEVVQLRANRERLVRRFWIEPQSRRFLGMEGDLSPEITDVRLEMLRWPDVNDLR